MSAQAVASQVQYAFVSSKQAPRRSRVVVTAVAREEEQSAALGRRGLLAGLLLAVGTPQAQAAVGRWDGESSAIGSCALGEAGNECRQQILLKDKSNFASYEDTAGNATRTTRTAYGVPVAELNTQYARDTAALIDKLLAYGSFEDPTDSERFKVIKELKTEMPTWVSKYARGGSVRSTSARKVYVVVDALSAHFAQNGLAPLSAFKFKKLVAELEEAQLALVEGR